MNPLLLSSIAIGISLIASVVVFLIYHKVALLCRVKDKEDIITLISSYQKSIHDVEGVHKDLLTELKRVGGMSYQSLQNVGFLRYNPFHYHCCHLDFTGHCHNPIL